MHEEESSRIDLGGVVVLVVHCGDDSSLSSVVVLVFVFLVRLEANELLVKVVDDVGFLLVLVLLVVVDALMEEDDE